MAIRRGHSQEDWAEFRELVHSTGAVTVAEVTGSREAPDSRYYVGTGKLAELQAAALDAGAGIILFNNELTPTQQRNLERALKCTVLDRTGIILDIFAQRARSFEGKLQVELAQLRYLSTRLVRGWTHLERQRGGIGLRGPGESQLETDRRLIRQRIKQLRASLEKVRQQRGQRRRARRRAALPIISLVGYTNAGKSTLFNQVSEASEYAADQLFATLDPKVRRFEVTANRSVVISDTVGFIRHLPHELVVAFRATLEEVQEADLLLHVIDAGAMDRSERVVQVEDVLEQIGADRLPRIEVYNKIDQLDNIEPHIERGTGVRPWRVWLSAATGQGIELLKQVIAEYLMQGEASSWLRLTCVAGQIRASLYDSGTVLEERIDDDGAWLLAVRVPRPYLEHLCRQDGVGLCDGQGVSH